MTLRILLGMSAAAALLTGFAACSLATDGLQPGTGGSSSEASSSASASTSTAASSGAGGSGGVGTGGSSSSGLVPEICFNNKDDDGNGQKDCADSACTTTAACADVPDGWTAVWVMKGVDPAAVPTPGMCADGKTRQAYYTQPAGLPTCSPCACEVAPTAQCPAPPLSCWYYSVGCNNTAGLPFMHQANTNKCIDIHGLQGFPNTPNGGGSCKLTGPAMPANSSACTTLGGAIIATPPWSGAVFVCDTPSSLGGCLSGQRCVDTVPSTDGPVCIKKDGSDACPSGWPSALSGFTGVKNDSRSCGACGCSINCMGGSYVVHDPNNCSNVNSDPQVTVDTSNCTPTPNLFDNGQGSLSPTLAMPMLASCLPAPATGQVDGNGQVQICCK